ncbi:hypothetical protein PWEIH_16708 [Listeria weihenstephanensis FSL R9-0317]|uniref:Uncharacterized protein n=1 Tax=Listeria weihenstephanensis TaxID=1006155 RepID=A0A1S7FXD6_9LIST|nr:DUF3958 family protein [Listeria weihenstephanensis]AQY52091.1 hypothetical protein UE46_14400 [Listeria weihenstephanensis]EUJ34738.1 hypothetical protein PWEIH_16708 [Listeria weihenstephanensis FSL R9-0317]
MRIEPRSEQIHQILQQLKKEYRINDDKLYEVKQKQARLESVEMTIFEIEREKEELLLQAREVWHGSLGTSVADDAAETGHQNLRKLRQTLEQTRDDLQEEKQGIQNRLYEIEEQRQVLHKELKR